ncbi:hypothetical protein AAF712_012440 [Marasmius tenuissimus]|uniref:Uncharacterized protein n=1 Tax=Marasmius tenuissimus TaxID=585030 RepID=A0ABR2ZGG9_9AGAR
MVEEAIRNGTYVPPVHGPWVMGGRRGGAGQVDLGKKPVMWEAWLGGGYVGAREKERDLGVRGPLGADEEKVAIADAEWQGLMPMSLQLLKEPVYVDLNNPNNSSASLNNGNGTANHSSTSLPNANNMSTPTAVLSRIRSTFGWRSSSRSTRPSPSISGTSPSDSPNPPPSTPPGIGGLGTGGVGIVPPWARLSEPVFRYSYPQPAPQEELPPQMLPSPPANSSGKMESPAKVRVSVMIAMPSRHPVISSGKEVRETQQAVVEEELPHLEVGSVEVDVDEAEASQEEKETESTADMKGKRSMSGVEVEV